MSALNFAARVFGHKAGLRRASKRLVKASILSCWAARLKDSTCTPVSNREYAWQENARPLVDVLPEPHPASYAILASAPLSP